MKPYLLLPLIFSCSFNLAFGETDEERYNKPFVPGGGDKVLLDKEDVGGIASTEKIFMTFFTPKDIWNSLPVVDLRKESSFTFSYEDAFKRAQSFHGDNPPTKDTTGKHPIRTELITIERITVIESKENLNNNEGKYYYYVHILQVYPPPNASLPEQPSDCRVIVLPTGWAAYPFFQFMKIKQ